MTALEILAVKLPDTEITESQRLLALVEIEQMIKNYCDIDAVPEALYFTWANMTADLLRSASGEESDEAVSSIKVGDTTVDFRKDAHKERVNAVILNYRQQLQDFRRIQW